MSCREILEFLMDYESHELSLGQRMLFDLHLRLCRPCRDYLDSYRKTVQIGRVCDVDEPTLPEELVRAILATQRGNLPPTGDGS